MTEQSADRPFVFVSYASVNRDRVIEIVDILEAEGVATWFDRSDIPGGTSYGPEIVSGIKNATAILLMCSEASLASRNVRQEIQLSWRHERPILPILLEPLLFPDDVAYWLEGAQWIEVLDQSPDIWLPPVRHALIRLGYTRISQPEGSDSQPAGLEFELPPNNLPAHDSALFGRERELRQIATLLEPGAAITLTGTGGSGKTRLAEQAALDNAIKFPDGIWFVDASAATTSTELAELIANVVGVQEAQPEPLSETLAGTLRDQSTLLIIDNLEQIPDASVLIDILLESGGPAVLATSRIPLKANAEVVIPVSPLEPPVAQPDTPASVIARNPAVQLFVERAKRVKPDFQLADGNAFEVAEICARLDGLPLAIELAAARSRLLHPAALLNRLESRLSLLTRGSSRSERHQTLQASIAWSYDLLTPEQQSVFRKLAVFAGGAPVDIVENVISTADDSLSADDVLDAIDELIDHSLLTIDRTQRSSDSTRVRMLETIREYAAEVLAEAGETGKAANAHAQAFFSLSTTLTPELETGQQASALNQLSLEQFNLVASLNHLIGSPASEDHQLALDMVSSLWRYWWMKGSYSEGIRLITAALDSEDADDAESRARALNAAGIMAFSLGDLAGARTFHEQALVLSELSGSQLEMARSRDNLGIVNIVSGDVDQGTKDFLAALAIYQEEADVRGEALALDHLAGAYHASGDLDAALDYATRYAAACRKLGDQHAIGLALQQIGMTLMYQGHYAEAIAELENARVLAESQGDPDTLGSALLNLASAVELGGDPAKAADLLSEALTHFEAGGDTRSIGYTRYMQGHVARALGRTTEAKANLETGKAMLEAAGQLDAVALCLESLAGVAVDQNDFERAARLLGEAHHIRESSGVPLPNTRIEEVDRDTNAARDALGIERFEALFSL